MRPPQVSRTLSSQSSNSTPSQYAPIPHRQNILSRVKSSILRRESFVLNQPLSAEDSIPDDLITSESKSWNINNSIKKLATIYLRSNIARLLVLFGAVLSCILYVIETYVENESYLTFSFVMDLIIFTLFATDYLFNILYATIKWKYILSSQGIIDLLSLLSIINVFNVSADLSFLPLFRLLRVIKVLRFFHIVSIMNVDRPKPPSASEAITFEIISLLITLILAIFLSASLLFTLMQQDPHSFLYTPDQEFSMKQDATFFDCVYIVLVIIATLGFGDFVPNNFVGRLFVVILLSSIVVLIPTKISQLVDTIGKKPRYMNEYIPESGQPHIVIFANLTQENFQKLITLILAEGTNQAEIFEDAVPIALMSPVQPSSQLQLLLVHPMNSRKVQFFVGSAKSQQDLDRVRACDAKGILLFNDNEKSDSIDVINQDDYSTKLKVVSLVNYLSQELTLRKQLKRPVIICQTLSHEVCTSLLNFGVDRLISLTNMKYTLLAYASLFPGFLSLFINLTVPSNIYNKKGSTTDPKKWKNEFEWGHSFELIEIPVLGNTSADIRRLSFSQTCRFLYERSNGTSICVAVAGYANRPGVILNPERRIRIEECKSLFVICNDVEVTLAMLLTENLKSIMRMLRSKREFGMTPRRGSPMMEMIHVSEDGTPAPRSPLPTRDSFKATSPRKRTNTSVSNSMDISRVNDTVTPITFKRHSCCYKKEVVSREETAADKDTLKSVKGDIPQAEEPVNPERVRAMRVHSNVLLQYWETKPTSARGHASDYSVIPQPSLRIDKDDFISHHRFKNHTVLVCAFSPQYSIPRIATAVETFLNAYRSKSSDEIVVVAAHAIEIEDFIQKHVAERNEIFDKHLLFVEGLPNSVPGLQSADVCHARCIVIIGNEYTGNDIDVTEENKEVNRDLYIVLAALELDSIFKFYIKLLRKHNRSAELPIVIQELYNESTVSFLPDLYDVYSRVPHIWEPYEKHVIHSSRGIVQTYADSVSGDEVGEGPEDTSSAERKSEGGFNRFETFKRKRSRVKLKHLLDHNYVPNPAYSQGRVLTGPVLDTLTVQMLFNPNILEFWQNAMGMRRYEETHPSHLEGNPIVSGSFDELEIPPEFRGTFGELFQYLLTCYGSIAIGLFRNPDQQSSYVAILPPQDSPVNVYDRVIVLLTNRAEKPPSTPASASQSPMNVLAALSEFGGAE